jgi:hypothetical protein
MIMKETLEKFLQSNEFKAGVIASTRASWGGSGYSVELLSDGTYNGPIWNNQIGNLYESPGVILGIPTFNDSDHAEAMQDGMSDEDFFDLAFANDEEELAQEMRDALEEPA